VNRCPNVPMLSDACWSSVVDRMAKFDRDAMKKTRLTTTALKSTGQPKFALEEEVKTSILRN